MHCRHLKQYMYIYIYKHVKSVDRNEANELMNQVDKVGRKKYDMRCLVDKTRVDKHTIYPMDKI